MRKLIVEKEFEKEIKEPSSNCLNNKLSLFNLYVNNRDKKINLKQSYLPKNFAQLDINKDPANLNEKNFAKISNNYSSDKNIIRLTKNFSNSFYNERSRSHLSNDDKKKLKSIISDFNKNKVITQQLFNQEKRLRLNGINKTNYFFLVNTEKYNKYKKNIKSRSRNKNNITKKFSCSIFNKKTRNLRLMTNNTNYSSSSMINRFNNKTNGILDTSTSESIYNNNLNVFRRQIINDFRDQEILENDTELSKMKYEDAIKVLENAENFYIKRAVETEKKFYKAKNNQLKNEVKEKDIENNEEKIEENKVETKIIPSLFKKSINNLSEIRKEKKRENTINLKDENILSKLNFVISSKKNRNRRNSVIFDQDINKSVNKLILYDKSENHRNSINKSINKSFQKKLNFTRDKNYLYNAERNKDKKLKIKTSEIAFNQNVDLNLLMPFFYKFHKKNRLNRIKEKSKDYANSILEINYLPYQPMKKTNPNCSFIKINKNNLSRAIKINTINKYLYNIEDEDLLLHNPKKLREELLKTHMKFYKISFKKKFNHNFLRKKLKPETIRKFAYIKDSYFGVPC